MALPDSLSDKIARSPLRFGMIAGFLGVPMLWMAGDSLVRIALGQRALPVESFWSYEISGALVGAFLGGQGAVMWAKWRSGNIMEARHLALVTGGIGVAFYVAQAALFAGTSPFFLADFARGMLGFVLNRHLPFLLCLLLLFAGLFGPRAR